MSLIIPANSAAVSGSFAVDNSLVFNGPDSANMTRSASGSSATKSTFSFWVKRTKLADTQIIHNFYSASNTYNKLYFDGNDQFIMKQQVSGSTQIQIMPSMMFKDTSAWYHIVYIVDPTESTEANRVKVYVNGVQITSFGTSTYPAEDAAVRVEYNQFIGREYSGDTKFFNGYLAEFVFLDGVAASIGDLGKFDEDSGIWTPINVSGLTFGSRGFYLDFEDSSALGNDAVGSNNFTANNLAAGDQSTDTCTNNYNVLTPANKHGSHTLSEGNTRFTGDTGYNHQGTTFGVNKGKWYVEIKHAQTRSKVFMLSLYDVLNTIYTRGDNNWFIKANGLTTFYIQLQNTNHASTRDYTFRKYVGTTQTTVTSTGGNLSGLPVGILGVYIDMDNKRIHFYNNGSALDGHNAASSTAGLGAIPAGTYALGLTDVRSPDGGDDGVLLMDWNFGSPNPNNIPSSGNTDANGYGNFEYSPTVGGVDYYAMNTKNLAEFG